MQASLKGLLAKEFVGAEAPPMVFAGVRPPAYRQDHLAEIADARAMQRGAPSEAGFLAEHACVLLPHETAVRDWDADVANVYRPEVASIIRERLLPGRRVEVLQGMKVVTRGGGNRIYGEGVHCDGPLTPDAYAANLGALTTPQAEPNWRRSFARDEVAGFMLINFWRPINMREPMRDRPLALCDPLSVEADDIFSARIPSVTPEGRVSRHLALRFNPGQRWRYYSAMTTNEVLVFKQCEFWKENPDAGPRANVFHTAFRDPTAPPNVEPRLSCEHRVGVMILRD
jgi:hypothetical protein